MALQRAPRVMDSYFEFKAGRDVDGYATARIADRVTLSFGAGSTMFTVMTLTAVEARAMANALCEAADASEKVLPAAPVAVATEAA